MLISRLATLRRDVLLNMLLGSWLVPPPLRAAAFRLLGMQLGNRVNVRARCFFGGTNVRIGTRTFVNYICFFDNSDSITLGENCSLGMEVMLCTSSHEIGDPDQRAGQGVSAPISIGDGCWLGTRVTVLPGVTIGDGCVIAAGSVVTGDCGPNGLYAGSPAKRIRGLI
jgi:maltose O-acetyltransferase